MCVLCNVGVLLGTRLPNPSGITGVMLCYKMCADVTSTSLSGATSTKQ